jgi:hypothetical protein
MDGLTDSADDDRFNELESTIAQILRDIRVIAQQLKVMKQPMLELP